jgi:hypothetical protein
MDAWAQILGFVGAGIGVYTGIRADLARMHERIERALSAAESAHARLDNFLQFGTTERRSHNVQT